MGSSPLLNQRYRFPQVFFRETAAENHPLAVDLSVEVVLEGTQLDLVLGQDVNAPFPIEVVKTDGAGRVKSQKGTWPEEIEEAVDEARQEKASHQGRTRRSSVFAKGAKASQGNQETDPPGHTEPRPSLEEAVI